MPTSPLSLHPRPTELFGLALGFDADRVVITVRGDVDLLTAPTLGELLRVTIAGSPTDVVLDLAGLSFMDARGLGVIARALQRMRSTGASLFVRSAPPQTAWLLDVTGLAPLLRIDEPGSDVDLAADLAKFRFAAIVDETVDAELAVVTKMASTIVEGAGGVSVTLERHGCLSTVAASNETVRRMDDHQYETGEGPCLAAATEGLAFHIESLVGETRWPAFVPLAIEQGIASILSTPVSVAGRVVGALNIYADVEGAFGPREERLAAVFAERASVIVGDGSDEEPHDDFNERVGDVLAAREVIAQAQGVIMARRGLGPEQASIAMYREARGSAMTVRDYAAVVVGMLMPERRL